MKISKLLVLTALWLVAGSVKAAVPDGVWSIPEPQGLEFTDVTFDDDAHYYLYQPGSKMFFASGNEWSTRAGIASFAYEVWFTSVIGDNIAPEGSYFFNDNCVHPDRNLGYKDLFTDGGGSTWVDHNWGDGGQTDYYWTVTKVGDSYRIQNTLFVGKEGNEGKFFGWKGDYTDTRLYMITPEEGVVDWKFVTSESYEAFKESEAYEAYNAAVTCYGEALSLKAALEKAEELGADISDQLAVYNNTASTADELKAAKTAIQAIIDAREALKKQLDECKAKGFTETAAYDEVFANGKATAAQLKKALDDLTAAFIEWGKGNASVENPADMTGMIKNPHFDNADCNTGWTAAAGGDPFGRGGTVSDGAERYQTDFDSYQTIKGLAPGVYAIGVYGYYRTGNYGGDAERHWLAQDAQSKAVKLYGKVGDKTYETPIANVMDGALAEPVNQGEITTTYTDADGNEVTVYVPNTMLTADYYFHTLKLYANKLLVAVDESGELTIGVKKTGTISGDWAMFDDFSLAYYGTGADAAQLFLDETKKNYSEMVLEEGTVYTEDYLTAYNESLNKEISANSYEEVAAAMAEIEAAKAALEKNIDLWKTWQAKIAEAQRDYVTNTDYENLVAIGDLADYVTFETEDILNAHSLTNEELEAEIAKIDEMMQAVKDEFLSGEVADGTDMTRFIKNPGFDEDKDIDSGKAEGWTIDAGTGTNITRGPLGQGNKDLMESSLGYMNYCFEAWHRYNWDVWQEIEDLPKGMYELNVQGYVRCEVSGYNRPDDINPDYPSPIYLYMNSAKAQFPSVYSQQVPEDKNMVEVETWSWTDVQNDVAYPNSMGAAAQCFGWGMYKMSTYGLIAKKGDKFRIGVKMEGNQDWWCIWDSFKLTYRKPTVEIVKPILENELAKLDPNQGMGSEVVENLTKVREDALAAIESGDAELMFDALVAVYDISDAISASIKRFNELTAANEKLAEAYLMAEVCAMSTIQEAKTLNETISDGIENHTYATDEVDGLLNEIAKMINRLGWPADAETASDENPVEVTTVIINPNYVDGDDHGWTGGAAINATAVDAELFNKNFNYYQVLQGLPAGTYQVTLTGFYRAGTADKDYTTWVEAPEENNNALLYAVGEAADTCATPLMRLASQAQVFESLPDGYAWASEVNTLAVPNSMTTGGDAFLTENPATGKNFYAGNCVTVKVGEEGKLTIGLKKDVHIDTDWTLWTNWQLFYFGKNSALQPDIYVNAIKEIGSGDAVKVEFFNLNGARLNNAKKGIVIMKQTMSDGSVKIKKTVMK